MAQSRIVDKSEWADMEVPDVYFSSGYHKASALIERDFSKYLLLEWKDETGIVYLPLIIRSIPGTSFFDATSAYGYGGPWCDGTPDTKEFRIFLDSWASENSIVCTFIRFHPLLDNAAEFSDAIPSAVVGPTAVWKLSNSDNLLSGMAKDHRKTYRRALRAGVEVRINKNPEHFTDFVNLYRTSMKRVSAAEFYRFSDDYWISLRDSLGSQSVLVEAVYEGRTIAGVWCFFNEKFFHYHLSGTSDEGRNLGGAVVCRLAGAEWGQERGISFAHSGGGAGGADSPLLQWKHKFDKEAPLLQFSVGKLIHNKQIYEELAEAYPESNYFPVWRDPINEN